VNDLLLNLCGEKALSPMLTGHMNPVLYQCPVTGLMVDHRFEPATEAGNYETTVCPACNQIHELHPIRQLNTPVWWSDDWLIVVRPYPEPS